MTAPAAPSTDGEAIADLANRVGRLTIDRHDPERFHVDRSEIVADLRRLAARVHRARAVHSAPSQR